jgi:hypothetical protein
MNKFKLEALFFFIFGLFHIHRIWAFIDSQSYNEFWLNFLEKRDVLFFILGILFIVITIVVILYFIKSYKEKKWWRWVYLFGGVYLFIDIILNLLNNNFIKNIVIKMYTLEQPYYNILWGLFIALGVICIVIGKYLWNYNDTKIKKNE